jgi:hypothetical protein
VPSGVGLSDQVVGVVLGAALPVEGPAMIAAAATRPIVINLMSIVTSPMRWRSFPVSECRPVVGHDAMSTPHYRYIMGFLWLAIVVRALR